MPKPKVFHVNKVEGKPLHPFGRYRLAKKMTLSELAAVLGISKSMLSKIEAWKTGVTKPLCLHAERQTEGALSRDELAWPGLYQ